MWLLRPDLRGWFRISRAKITDINIIYIYISKIYMTIFNFAVLIVPKNFLDDSISPYKVKSQGGSPKIF